jgi:periplasmic protein TonB
VLKEEIEMSNMNKKNRDEVKNQPAKFDVINQQGGGFKRHLPYLSFSTIFHLFLIFLLFPIFMVMPSQPNTGKITTMDIVISEDDRSDNKIEKPFLQKKIKKIDPDPTKVDSEKIDNEVEGGDSQTPVDNDVGATLNEGVLGDSLSSELLNRKILNRYILKIRDRIEKKKKYPRVARINDEEGTTTVSFLIDSSGSVVVMKVVLSSGYQTLDDAALNTILKASPYPPIPARLNRKKLNLKVPIKYELR